MENRPAYNPSQHVTDTMNILNAHTKTRVVLRPSPYLLVNSVVLLCFAAVPHRTWFGILLGYV